MSVTSCKTTVIPFVGHGDTQLAMVVSTKDQSIKGQPLLWLVHGSGGVSSGDQLWAAAAMDRGFTVVWIDHYGPRGIYKMNHRLNDTYHLYHFNLAVDIHLAMPRLLASQSLIPFVDIKQGIKMVGFSSGGSAVIYAVTPDFDHSMIAQVAALYPGLWPLTDKAITADGSKINIYVGADDDWTRPEHSQAFHTFAPEAKLVILPNTKHSFSKPGAGGHYDEVHNVSQVPFEIPTPMHELMTFSGRYREIYDHWAGRFLGASAEYNHNSTAAVIDDFLGPLENHNG